MLGLDSDCIRNYELGTSGTVDMIVKEEMESIGFFMFGLS
jgi:hypothetical protein